MAKITSPVEGYEGVGAGGVQFKDGVAHTDDKALIRYFRNAGYGVDDSEPVRPEAIEPVDPRLVVERTANPLRDAAVDPKPGDYLPPTNAGQANPHGPLVVAPGIHGSTPGPIVPGPVSDQAGVQQGLETAVADATLVQQHDVGDVTQAASKANPQPRDSKDGAVASAEFDPSAHTVPEVLAYIEGTDRDEALRVLDAEASEGGKQRTTVLSAREGVEARES